MLKTYPVLAYVVITVVLSFAAYFIPVPDETRSLLVPITLVFIPTIVCIPLTYFTEGNAGLRQLFAKAAGGIRWLLIGALVGAAMRVAVLLIGTVLGMSVKADLSAPGTWLVVFATVPLAYFEELGWRRFALHRLLKSRSPIESSLLLGLPWGIIHLVITLPNMISANAPAVPQTIVLLCLGFVLTWAYIHSGGSVLTVTLLHGLQNGLVVLNRGLSLVDATWLMMGVYLLIAIVFILTDRRSFFAKPSSQ